MLHKVPLLSRPAIRGVAQFRDKPNCRASSIDTSRGWRENLLAVHDLRKTQPMAVNRPGGSHLMVDRVGAETWLPILIAIILVGIPVILAPFDFWDGRILYHALETNQNHGVRNWFLTSGWHLQYLIFSAVQFIAEVSGLSGYIILRLITLTALCGVVFESVRFSTEVAGLPRHWAIMVGITVAVFPAWNTLLSSVLFMYVLCVWFVLLAVRLINQRKAWSLLAGVPLLVISLQLNSNFSFSIMLGAAYFTGSCVHNWQMNRGALLSFLIIFITSVVVFMALRIFFTPSGLYADYNKILSLGSWRDLFQWVIEIARYFEYPVVVLIILITTHFLLEAARRMGFTNFFVSNRSQSVFSKQRSELLWPFVLSIILLGAAAFPYVAVGKAADLRVFYDWNQRHTFLLALPTGLFLVSSARFLSKWHGLRGSRWQFLPLAVGFAALACLQLAGTWGKLSRAAYEAGIVNALQHVEPPKAGIVEITAPDLPSPRMRFYESNWLLYMAYGREDWQSAIVVFGQQPVSQPKWLETENSFTQIYKSKHIMRTFRYECRTGLNVTGEHYNISQVVAWVIGISLPDKIGVTQSSEDCTTTVDE